MKATEGARLDQRRLLLSVNHNGTILQVNPGTPCAAWLCLSAHMGERHKLCRKQ
jgi:hypothetical protein